MHVEAKLYGAKFNDTSYGASDITSDFTIGRNQVVIADVNSHELVVKQDGTTVASYPASYGRGEDTGDPNLITRSGIHVVNEFFETKLMSNPRYGYTNSPNAGPSGSATTASSSTPTRPAPARRATPTSPTAASTSRWPTPTTYYHSAIWGDPVEVSGTSVQLSPADGEIYIWAMPFDEFKTLSAL